MLFTTTIALTGDGKKTYSLAVFYISSDQYLKIRLKTLFQIRDRKTLLLFYAKKKKLKRGGKLSLLTMKERVV